jgi:hypothetical protein
MLCVFFLVLGSFLCGVVCASNAHEGYCNPPCSCCCACKWGWVTAYLKPCISFMESHLLICI